jgi:large subunit ribosomal protein L31
MAEGDRKMKKNIHPNYVDTKVICACGNEFTVKSNKNELHVEVCDKCHPFFTGKQGTATKTGRVEKFNRKYGINTEK